MTDAPTLMIVAEARGHFTMIKQVLFVQGAGKGAHDLWDAKLVQSLERELGAGYAVLYPRMPKEDEPRYPAWQAALFDEFASLEDGAILIGHSVGGTMLIHALTNRPPSCSLGGIFLLATPFIGEGGWPSAEIKPRTDFSSRIPPGVPLFLYHGTEDDTVPIAHLHLYAKAIPNAVIRTCGRTDHQLNNDLSQVARDIRAAQPVPTPN